VNAHPDALRDVESGHRATSPPLGSGAVQRTKPQIKPGGGPAFTRVGAVLSIEEKLDEVGGGCVMEHDVVLAHNPYATSPVPEGPWRDLPQLVRRDDHMAWTDEWRGL
jgi:hypothetical protein